MQKQDQCKVCRKKLSSVFTSLTSANFGCNQITERALSWSAVSEERTILQNSINWLTIVTTTSEIKKNRFAFSIWWCEVGIEYWELN